MPTLTIELPIERGQTAFNLQRWSELQSSAPLARELARFEGRVETNRHGHIILLPIPPLPHGMYLAEVSCLLHQMLPDGRVVTVCPISTADGVKSADAVWLSKPRLAAIGGKVCLSKAPEICVEVLSPDNTRAEMAEKKALYFAGGAREVWFCAVDGCMTFFVSANSRGLKSSKFCPEFPREIRF